MSTPVFVQKFLAKKIADLMYAPSGIGHPSRKTVMKRESKSLGMNLEAIYAEFSLEKFSLPNDGIVIPAEYHPIPNAKGVAILSHGFGQNRYVLTPQAKIFHDLGYSTVMYDQRHFGESTAPYSTFSMHEALDLIALCRWVKTRCGDSTPIVVLGVSMGAMSLMHAIGQTDLIDAAIEDCGPCTMEKILLPFYQSISKDPNPYLYDMILQKSIEADAPMTENNPIEGVAASDTPLLILHGESDSLVAIAHAKDILKAARHPLSRMRSFPGREHAYSIQDYDQYRDTIAAFLADVFAENRTF